MTFELLCKACADFSFCRPKAGKRVREQRGYLRSRMEKVSHGLQGAGLRNWEQEPGEEMPEPRPVSSRGFQLIGPGEKGTCSIQPQDAKK